MAYRQERFFGGIHPTQVGANVGDCEYGRVPSVWQKNFQANPYVKVGGIWVVTAIWVKVAGIWLEAFGRGKVAGEWVP